MTGPHRCHASAASSHCARVVILYCCGSNVLVMVSSRMPGRRCYPVRARTRRDSRQKPASTFAVRSAGRGLAGQCRCARVRRPHRAAGPADRRLPGRRRRRAARSPAGPALVLVTGEAGIGKTALLTRFAGRRRADGGTVRVGYLLGR